MNLRQKRSFVGMSSGAMLLVRGIDTQPYTIIIDDRTEMIHKTRPSLLISGRVGLSIDKVATTTARLLLHISSNRRLSS